MSFVFDFLSNAGKIAVVGASPDSHKIGNAVLDNLIKGGFKGEIYPVNPTNEEIMGLKCYRSIEELDPGIDLAVIALPAKTSVQVLDQCVKKKVKFVIIVAGGFSELGEEGRKLEEQIGLKIRGTGTRIIGPNTVGVLFPHSNINTALTPSDRLYYPGKGSVAFVSQSGALGLLMMDSITEYNMGISGFVNIGNRSDISEVDLMQMFGEDPRSRSIVLYLESISDGEAFYRKAREISSRKPIVVLKTGRSVESSKAASFHTGAMATDDRVLDGILKQAGVVRAYNEVELLDYGKALAYQQPLRGDRIAVITTAGGVGVVTTDLLTAPSNRVKLKMATFDDMEIAELKKHVLPIASVNNPIDLTADGSSEAYASILQILTESRNLDGIIAFALPQTPKIDVDIVEPLKAASKKKPLVAGVIGNRLAKKVLIELEKERIPAYPSIERTVGAMQALYSYGRMKERLKHDS